MFNHWVNSIHVRLLVLTLYQVWMLSHGTNGFDHKDLERIYSPYDFLWTQAFKIIISFFFGGGGEVAVQWLTHFLYRYPNHFDSISMLVYWMLGKKEGRLLKIISILVSPNIDLTSYVLRYFTTNLKKKPYYFFMKAKKVAKTCIIYL